MNNYSIGLCIFSIFQVVGTVRYIQSTSERSKILNACHVDPTSPKKRRKLSIRDFLADGPRSAVSASARPFKRRKLIVCDFLADHSTQSFDDSIPPLPLPWDKRDKSAGDLVQSKICKEWFHCSCENIMDQAKLYGVTWLCSKYTV